MESVSSNNYYFRIIVCEKSIIYHRQQSLCGLHRTVCHLENPLTYIFIGFCRCWKPANYRVLLAEMIQPLGIYMNICQVTL